MIDRSDCPSVTCHVDTFIEAIACAVERGSGGRAYFVNARETGTFRDFVDMIASTQSLSTQKLRSMPYGLAFALGRMMELFATLAGRKDDPPLSRSLVRMIGREFTTSGAAGRRELGYVGAT